MPLRFGFDRQKCFYGYLGLNTALFLYTLLTDSYPWWLVILYGLMNVGAWVWILKDPFLWRAVLRSKLDWIIGFGLIVLAFAVYLYRIEEITPGMWGDEVTVGYMGLQVIQAKAFTPFLFVNYGHATPLLYLTGWTIAWLGRTMTAIRLVSIIFGALNIGLIYILLRQWLSRWVSSGGALLLLWCYGYIVTTRFAYEMTAAIFFELLAFLWIVLGSRTHQLRYWVAYGLSVGLGLMTYLSFRTLGVGLVGLAGLVLYQQHRLSKPFFIRLGLVVSMGFVGSWLIISYGLRHPDEIWARTKSISIFHQSTSTEQFATELFDNVRRLSGVVVGTGDPNGRQNPSSQPMVDPVLVGLALIGVLALAQRRRHWLWLGPLVILPTVFNDILTFEKTPLFSFYPYGHPNTLRLSGLFPVLVIAAAWGIDWIIAKLRYRASSFIVVGITSIMSAWFGYTWYFRQPYLPFNHEVNEVRMLEIAKTLKAKQVFQALLSPVFAQDQRVRFFAEEHVKLIPFDVRDGPFELGYLPVNTMVVLDPFRQHRQLVKTLLDHRAQLRDQISIEIYNNPWGEPEVVYVQRK